MNKIGVIGGGSWATALVKILINNNIDVYWWMRSKDQMDHIIKHGKNPKYLSTCNLQTNQISLTTNINDLLSFTDTIFIATPAAFIDDIFSHIDPLLLENTFIVSAVKGIIPQTNQLPVHYFSNKFNKSINDIGIITGPCHAEEVAMERLSYLTTACTNLSKAKELAAILQNRYIHCLPIIDSLGAELSSVLKNIYALAAGVCSGLGYGDNFLSVLISNASQESERFIHQIYSSDIDVKSSAYLGDLLVTAYSVHSRNRRFGLLIGKGYSVKATTIEMKMIAEGYLATKCVHELNLVHNIDAPIAKAMYHILYENISPKVEIKILSDIIN